MMKPDIQHLFASRFEDENGTYSNQLDQGTIQTIFDHGLFKCFLPPSYGGLGLSLAETLEIIEACAYINGSLGWLIQIGNGGMYFASNFNERISMELFSPVDTVIAGSGAPSGIGTKTEGGYLLTGTWNYCSGADYATLFTVTFADQETNAVHAAILPAEKVVKSHTWNAIGLQNTSTNTIHLNFIFVPHDHVFNVAEQQHLTDLPIFTTPFMIYAQLFFVHVVFGVYDRFLTESTSHVTKKHAHWSQHFPNRLKRISNALTDGQSLLTRYRVNITEQVKQTDESNLKGIVDLIQVSADVRNSVHNIFGLLGIEVLDRNHVIAVCYQDIIATTQHYLLVDH